MERPKNKKTISKKIEINQKDLTENKENIDPLFDEKENLNFKDLNLENSQDKFKLLKRKLNRSHEEPYKNINNIISDAKKAFLHNNELNKYSFKTNSDYFGFNFKKKESLKPKDERRLVLSIIKSHTKLFAVNKTFVITERGIDCSQKTHNTHFISVGRQQVNDQGIRPNDIMLFPTDPSISRSHFKIYHKDYFDLIKEFENKCSLMSGFQKEEGKSITPEQLGGILKYIKPTQQVGIEDLGTIYGTYVKIRPFNFLSAFQNFIISLTKINKNNLKNFLQDFSFFEVLENFNKFIEKEDFGYKKQDEVIDREINQNKNCENVQTKFNHFNKLNNNNICHFPLSSKSTINSLNSFKVKENTNPFHFNEFINSPINSESLFDKIYENKAFFKIPLNSLNEINDNTKECETLEMINNILHFNLNTSQSEKEILKDNNFIIENYLPIVLLDGPRNGFNIIQTGNFTEIIEALKNEYLAFPMENFIPTVELISLDKLFDSQKLEPSSQVYKASVSKEELVLTYQYLPSHKDYSVLYLIETVGDPCGIMNRINDVLFISNKKGEIYNKRSFSFNFIKGFLLGSHPESCYNMTTEVDSYLYYNDTLSKWMLTDLTKFLNPDVYYTEDHFGLWICISPDKKANHRYSPKIFYVKSDDEIRVSETVMKLKINDIK